MTKFIIANWKMNLTISESEELCKKINECVFDREKVIIAPPIAYISYLQFKFPNLIFASQDVSIFENFGAYTGENSAKILSSIGIKYNIIAHSERRKYFLENNETAKIKMINSLNSKITPIICIGDETKNNSANLDNHKNIINPLQKQIKEIFCNFSDHENSKNYKNNQVFVAYEPTSSIGTGVIPDLAILQENLNFIYHEISQVAKNFKIVYGGSVNSKNYKKILELEKCDGILIGASSLIYEEFREIIENLC